MPKWRGEGEGDQCCTVLYKVNFLLSDPGRRSKSLLLMFNSSTCSLLWQKLLCKSAQNDQVWNVKIRFTALTNTEDKCVQCWLNELLIPLFQFSVHIRNMICTEIGKYGLLGAKKSWCKAREAAAALLLLSTPPTLGGGRCGEGCSHPATHQIGRSTISNTSGNSLDLPFNVLRVFWRSVMQCCQWFAPPSCARLDCRHCSASSHFVINFDEYHGNKDKENTKRQSLCQEGRLWTQGRHGEWQWLSSSCSSTSSLFDGFLATGSSQGISVESICPCCVMYLSWYVSYFSWKNSLLFVQYHIEYKWGAIWI